MDPRFRGDDILVLISLIHNSLYCRWNSYILDALPVAKINIFIEDHLLNIYIYTIIPLFL